MLKKYIIIQTHSNKKDLLDVIAEEMIDDRLAACVNIYPNEYSLYKYNDKIVKDKRIPVSCKNNVDYKFDEIARC